MIISATALSLRLLPTAPPRPTAARPSGDHPGFMAKRGDRLRVGVPISAPRTELKGASERAERRRATRVRRRARGERLAVYEDELEVLAARGLHLLRVRVVPVRECLQECAGWRVGGIGGGRSGALWVFFFLVEISGQWRERGDAYLGAPAVVHLDVGCGGGQCGFRFACLPPEQSQKIWEAV